MNEQPFAKLWPESKNVVLTNYNPVEKTLTVEFTGKKVYRYINVPILLWDKLVKAESIGNFLNDNVKLKYQYTEVIGKIK